MTLLPVLGLHAWSVWATAALFLPRCRIPIVPVAALPVGAAGLRSGRGGVLGPSVVAGLPDQAEPVWRDSGTPEDHRAAAEATGTNQRHQVRASLVRRTGRG
ncbi:hypothetical protein SAMN05660350_04258 [Geodermatophilus obscurus]|uniref:Uncharacterized protein n=1 Tax=Geodermatophilus obscurus TaxID=1861 RepID=A0A1M7UY72_9ACTN|nr:hypothetical protein [Geodermatophilus obscurus]SHN87866.1 hypothetical protein SAMN05660350_04258 [Geodermatophilus obscurus]